MLSVGILLKQTREKLKYSLKDAEKHIKIRQKYIAALEQDSWELFTSKIYIEGVLKNYARFLQLDEAKVIAFFRREYEKKEEIRFKRRVHEKYLSPDSKKTLRSLFIGMGILIGLYVAFQFYLYLKPPHLRIQIPQTVVTKNIDRMTITGDTEKEAVLTINSERVYLDKDGRFEYILPLKRTKNVVNFDVVGANGKKTSETRTIMKKE
jgi:cytoskeletal protein RodZ